MISSCVRTIPWKNGLPTAVMHQIFGYFTISPGFTSEGNHIYTSICQNWRNDLKTSPNMELMARVGLSDILTDKVVTTLDDYHYPSVQFWRSFANGQFHISKLTVRIKRLGKLSEAILKKPTSDQGYQDSLTVERNYLFSYRSLIMEYALKKWSSARAMFPFAKSMCLYGGLPSQTGLIILLRQLQLSKCTNVYIGSVDIGEIQCQDYSTNWEMFADYGITVNPPHIYLPCCRQTSKYAKIYAKIEPCERKEKCLIAHLAYCDYCFDRTRKYSSTGEEIYCICKRLSGHDLCNHVPFKDNNETLCANVVPRTYKRICPKCAPLYVPLPSHNDHQRCGKCGQTMCSLCHIHQCI
jgi:ribosomal protein S27AE